MAYIATFQATANPTHVDTIKRSLSILERESRTQPGTIRYKFYQAKDDPTIFMLFAIWEREADWKNHVESDAHERHVRALPDGAWVSPPQPTRWQTVAD